MEQAPPVAAVDEDKAAVRAADKVVVRDKDAEEWVAPWLRDRADSVSARNVDSK